MQGQAQRMAAVFPDPKKATQLMVQRMFEERVQPALER
jgi:hypothetical protein